MSAISNALAVTWKEIQVLVRDRGSLAVLFLLPLLFGALYGSINLQFAGDGDETAILLRVGLVDEDGDVFGREITKALGEIDELDVTALPTADRAEEEVSQGNLAAAIILPEGLSRDIDAYRPVEIEVIVDPAQPEGASIVSGIMSQVATEVEIWGEIQYGVRAILDESGALAGADEATQRAVAAQSLGVIMTRLNMIRRSPAILVSATDLAGVEVSGGITTFFALMFPGITIMFVFFIVGAAGSSLLGEREAGTIRRLLASPCPRWSVIGGKALAYMLLVCLQVVVLFGVASLFFKMPLGRSPMGLTVLTVVLAFTATSMGLMIAGLAKSSKQADTLGTLLGFVLAGLGGCIAMGPDPLPRAEGFMGVLARLTPHAHALEGYYQVMAEGASFVQILPEIGILLGMGIAFFTIAVWRFRFE